MALFARTIPVRKLIVLAGGSAVPAGKAVRKPSPVGLTMVRLAAMTFAVDGTPHTPATGNSRTVPAASAGPPRGPFALRVSAMRHGVNVWKSSPTCEGGVGVTVGVGVAVGGVGVGVGVGDGVGVGPEAVGVGVAVRVGVGVRVGVAVGVGVRVG